MMIQFIIQMTLPLKVKRSTINNYAETIDVNWNCRRQTGMCCQPPYWYLNWPPNLKHALIMAKLFMQRECVCVCACACVCARLHWCTNESEVCAWFPWRSRALNILFLIGIYFLRHYFFSTFQCSNKTASIKHLVNCRIERFY